MMGSCVGKGSPVHPLEPRGHVKSLQTSKGSRRIRVRMRASEFKELVASKKSEAEIGQLILQGCLSGRWQATSVSHACRKIEFALPRSLEPIKE